MDKIRLDFFDILGYLIPGTALLLALWVTADDTVVRLADLYGFVSKINTNTLLSGIVVAYVMGFTLHLLGSFLFAHCYLPCRRFLKKETAKAAEKRADYVSHYWAQLRENGEKHLQILDRWQALKAFSTNLAAFSMVAACLCLWKWHCTGVSQWLGMAPLFLLLYASYSNRARKFGDFLDSDSAAVLDALNLRGRLPHPNGHLS